MKPKLEDLTLREKIAQTGMVAPSELIKGAQECGDWAAYFQKYPFSGVYLNFSCRDLEGNPFTEPLKLGEMIRDASVKAKIPLLVTCDEEMGGDHTFPGHLHPISPNLAIGAAGSEELAYWRTYYWAKEMRSFGVNWVFGPVVDLVRNFFKAGSLRSLGYSPELLERLVPHMIRAIHDAGLADCVKHYPSGGDDYRDSHFSSTTNNTTREDWYKRNFPVWKAAVDAGTSSIMTSHASVPAFDPSFAREGVPRPGTASKPVLDIIRNELNYDGIVITDAVSMKGLAAAFEPDDIYIECFNAGNDIILFCRNDYIDVMEKAVLDGRVSEERINESCRRVLDLKEKLGLFEGVPVPVMPTEEDVKALEQACYNVSKAALTLINNKGNMIPFDPKKVKKVGICKFSPSTIFDTALERLIEAFEARGIETELRTGIIRKTDLLQLDETCDIIVYACYLASGDPRGMMFFSGDELTSLFSSLSCGANKTVVCSFGDPSIYYNYFEHADAYINAYAKDAGTMKAFVDGILGDFEFTGKTPVPLCPKFLFD